MVRFQRSGESLERHGHRMGERTLELKYPSPNPRVAWRTLGDEVIIVTPDESVLYALNPTGSFIWQQATGQRTVQEIIAALLREFETEPEAAAADAAEFLQSLNERGLLRLTDQPGNHNQRE